MPSKQNITVIIIISVAVVLIAVVAVIVTLPRQNSSNNKHNESFAANDSRGSNNGNSLTVISISGGSLVGGSKYIIFPNPFTGQGSYAIQDGSNDDRNPANGIIVVNGLHEGN